MWMTRAHCRIIVLWWKINCLSMYSSKLFVIASADAVIVAAAFYLNTTTADASDVAVAFFHPLEWMDLHWKPLKKFSDVSDRCQITTIAPCIQSVRSIKKNTGRKLNNKMHSIIFTTEFIYPMFPLALALCPSRFCRHKRPIDFSACDLSLECMLHSLHTKQQQQQQKCSFIEAHISFSIFSVWLFSLFTRISLLFLIHST